MEKMTGDRIGGALCFVFVQPLVSVEGEGRREGSGGVDEIGRSMDLGRERGFVIGWFAMH